MNPRLENIKPVQVTLEQTAVILSDVLTRLGQFEKLGNALIKRYQSSTTTRVCLRNLLPQLKELYPDESLFEESPTNG